MCGSEHVPWRLLDTYLIWVDLGAQVNFFLTQSGFEMETMATRPTGKRAIHDATAAH